MSNSYQQHVAKIVPANKKWKTTTEITVNTECTQVTPYLNYGKEHKEN